VKLIALLLALASTCSSAMSIERRGDALHLGGKVEPEDLERVTMMLATDVRRVVLNDSEGGNMATSLRISSMLEIRGLTTEAAGHCASACAIIFLGGKTRTITTGSINLHGAKYIQTGEPSAYGNELQARFIARRTDGKFPSGLLYQAMNLQGRQLLTIMPRGVYVFDGKQLTVLPYRLQDLGIVTQ
jgi:hypothetical protein